MDEEYIYLGCEIRLEEINGNWYAQVDDEDIKGYFDSPEAAKEAAEELIEANGN